MMFNFEHTPGPWKELNGEIIYDVDFGGPFRSVCKMNGNNDIANARLIAAAPEMFDALEQVEVYLDKYSFDSPSATTVLGRVRTALAIARGRA